MAKNKSPKVLTKKHLARVDRERRQTRLITGVAAGIIAIVILAIAYGLLNDTLFLNWRPVVTVNGQTASMHEFQLRVRVARQQLIGQYMQYTQLAQMFGMDPSTDPQMSQSLNQITQELDTPSVLGGQVVDDMVNDLLIRQWAKKNGITVTAADIENAAQGALRFYPEGSPTPTLTPTIVVYPTLDATQLALVTSTLAPTLAPTATLAPTQTLAPTPTPNLNSTATPIPSLTPTSTPYTLKGYQSQYQTTVKAYYALGLNDAQFRNIFFESTLYHDRVQAKVTADVPHQQDEVWIRDIQVADLKTANDVRAQLLAGADFATLAAKYSIDTNSKDKGGDLGWLAADQTAIPAEITKTAFTMKVSYISAPIKSTSSYDIIQLLGHEVRPLSETEYQTAVTTAFNNWIAKQSTASKVVINSSWTNYVPTSPTLAQAQSSDNATATSYVATAQAGAKK
jgi:peptidyl-prolyl cis-trans isomerase D